MFSTANIISLAKANAWKVSDSTDFVAAAANAGADGYGIKCKLTDRDSRYVIVVTNTHSTDAATVAVQPGNGIQATLHTPTISLAAGKTAYIQVESGKFQYVSDNGPMASEAGDAGPIDVVFVTSSSASVKACVLHTVL